MAAVNLKAVGYAVDVDLQGAVEVHAGKGPPFILLAETHENNNVIGQNLLSAVNLFDANVVGIVGVEQYPPPPFDLKAKMEAEHSVRRDGGIEKYGEDLLKMFGGTIQGVVAEIRKTPKNRPQSFARNLVFVRPKVNIIGVEDPALKADAQAASEAAGRMFLDELDLSKREKLQIAEFRKSGEERERKRDAAFVKYATEAHAKLGSGSAVVLNGGGLHMKRIADTLRKEGKACLLIVPVGYTDALD
jgi:hypothetical protein